MDWISNLSLFIIKRPKIGSLVILDPFDRSNVVNITNLPDIKELFFVSHNSLL